MLPKSHLEDDQIPAQDTEPDLGVGGEGRHNLNQAMGFFFLIILNWKRICVDLRKKDKLIEVYVN